MMNKFKIKPIRVRGRACQLYSSLLGAHTCWPNEPQILHQHHLHQIIGHPEHPRTNPAHKFRWRLYQSHHTKSTSEAHQGEGNSGHHEHNLHGHLQLSLCQIPLQTQPTWPRRELLRHHQENSYITVMISSQPAIATKINKYIQQQIDKWELRGDGPGRLQEGTLTPLCSLQLHGTQHQYFHQGEDDRP